MEQWCFYKFSEDCNCHILYVQAVEDIDRNAKEEMKAEEQVVYSEN